MSAVEFRNVDIVFGNERNAALQLLDEGADRQAILEQTGCVLGVADASISIAEGEICVLMGLSGSGKSTLLRCVNRLNHPTRGEVLLDDPSGVIDIARCNKRTLRRLRRNRVAMVFQQFALLPWRTVAENVGLGLELRGMGSSDRRAVVAEKLKLVGLDQWADKYAHELSGGMQQRVGLARAFATDADILLMDEPFSALDPLIRDHLQDELLELQHNLKKTIIFVSHDLDEALKLGTHIAIMDGGRIVQYGEPEQIVLKPANQYVADFVAHMNPLNVLRGGSLMTPVEKLKRSGDAILLDSSARHRIRLGDQGQVLDMFSDDQLVKLQNYHHYLDLSGQRMPLAVIAPVDILMQKALEIKYATGRPLLLQTDERIVGVIGDDEIYRGLLRQPQATA
ncbi:MAG: choline ABC transporter ATP-binding protein [Candidatus Competibacteraceae bacterium]|nr:choline ABC transporter ATP-binding protein [Candidatus Competibacteraceae bacterium]